MEQPSSNKKHIWYIPGVLIVLVIVFAVLISVISEGEGSVSFEKTKKALDDLLSDAEQEFTHVVNFDVIASSQYDSEAWLVGSYDDPVLGEANAAITIMEFSDFQCPFCKASFPSIREFIESSNGKVKYVYRDFPVDDIHPDARSASEAGACAHEQGKFWAFHDRVFQNQSDLSRESLIRYALQAGVSKTKFITCFNERTYKNEVEEDRVIGVDLGVRGTPTWFINGQKLEGVIPVDVWEQIIERLER